MKNDGYNGGMNQEKNPLLRRIVAGLLLGLVVIVALMLASDLRQVLALMRVFRWEWLPLVLCATLFNYTLRFIKFHYYLGLSGVKNLPWPHSLRLFVAGFPLAVTPGKVGEVLKAVWVKDACGLPVAKGTAVVVAERLSDGLAVLGLASLGVAIWPQYWPAFTLLLAGLLGVVIVSQIRPLALWFLRLGEKLPLVRRFVHNLREFYEGSFVLLQPKAILMAVGLGMVSWLGEGIGFYLILMGLGQPASTALLISAVFILSFSTLVGAVSALPGGLGAAEISIAGMLVVLAGLSPSCASAATLLIRLATLWFGVLLGLGAWAFWPKMVGLKAERVE